MDNYGSNNNSAGSQALKDFQLTTDVASKKDPEFGIKIARSVRDTVKGGWGNYYWLRNDRFRVNRDWANGRIDVRRMFGDLLDMNGKVNYSNLIWEASKIVNTAIGRIVGGWMGRSEKIQVTAIDPASVSKKNEQADDVEFDSTHAEMLTGITEKTGVPLIPQEQFIAEDKDQLDEWKLIGNRLPEEISYELGVNTIFEQNGFFGVLKEKMLHDSAETGLVGTYTEMDGEGQIRVIEIAPENAVYSNSEFPDFRDTSIRGHILSMKISECRAKYPKLTEHEIFKLAQTCKEWSPTDKITWIEQWATSLYRPYDEWNFDCLQFELKSFDKDNYTVTKTKSSGTTYINKGNPVTRTGKPRETPADNQEVFTEKKWNIYKGVYAMDADMLLEWGLKKNMIRPQDPKEIGQVEFSYSYYMPQSYKMRNIAIPEKVEVPVKGMILTLLKIQQCIAKAMPPGSYVNVDAMQEIELGLAGGATTPMEAQRIYQQTGVLFYRGRDAEGNQLSAPIAEAPNAGFSAQMEAYIKLYAFHYQTLKDELGNDPNLMQQASKPRVSEGNINTANQLSDNATDHYYDAYLYVMEETAKKVACLLNVSVTFDAKAYRHILKQDDVKGRNFSTKAEMLPTQQEMGGLAAMMQNAVAANPVLASYLDQFRIMRVAKENIKLAELLFSNSQKRMIKTEQAIAQQNSQQNAEIQTASIEAKAEADAKAQAKKDLSQEKLELLKGSIELLKAGVEMPPEMKAIMFGVLKNVSLPLMIENAALEQEVAATEQQMQQQESEQMGMEQPQPEQQLQAA